jgi:hypothetical protein
VVYVGLTASYMCTELKGYISEASKDLTKEVKTWAGSAWASFNKVIKARIAPTDPSNTATAASDEQPEQQGTIDRCNWVYSFALLRAFSVENK